MLNKEIIKWGCKFANGFEYEGSTYTELKLLTPLGVASCNSNRWEQALYPLFLQRLIEGINKQFSVFGVIVVQNHQGVFILEGYEMETIYSLRSISNFAKEQTIKYIYKELNK